MITVHNTTYTAIVFYTWANGKVPVNDPTFGIGTTGPVVSVSTTKRFGSAAGSFTIELKGYAIGGPFDGVPWTDLVVNGDWVTIDILKNGKTSMAMVGKVDNVDVGIQAGSSGESRVVVTITGRDAGAPLEDTPVYFNPFDPVHNNAAGKDMAAILTTVTGAPHEVITGAIRGLFGTDGLFGGHVKVPPQLYGPTETPWVDVLGMDGSTLGGTVQENLRGTVFAPSMLTTENAGTVWAFLESWRNPAMNEFWIDSTSSPTPRRWYLFLRERPFVNGADGTRSPWYGLRARNVDARTISGVQFKVGGNRVNHVMLMGEETSILGKDAYALYQPVADFDSVERYGLKKLEEQSRYFDSEGGDSGFVTEYRSWLDLVLAWNCLNHRHLEGSITLGEIRADIRMGHKLAITNGPIGGYTGFPADGAVAGRGLTFYVEGTTHRWAAGRVPTCTTTLQVSRGFIEGDRLNATITEAGKFRGAALVPEGSANQGDFEPADSAGGVEAGLEGVV